MMKLSNIIAEFEHLFWEFLNNILQGIDIVRVRRLAVVMIVARWTSTALRLVVCWQRSMVSRILASREVFFKYIFFVFGLKQLRIKSVVFAWSSSVSVSFSLVWAMLSCVLLTRPMMKWNQEDLGKAPHRRQGICTAVRGPSPRPSGKAQDNLKLVLKKRSWHHWRKMQST